MAAVIDIAGLSVSFGGPAAAPVLVDLTLSVEKGQLVVLVGPSGVGKSTLLRIIAGLLPAASGRVQVNAAAEAGRRALALVFQDARLLPWRRVLGNTELGLEGLGLTRRDRRARASQALALVGLDALAGRWPHELSGGQRQRVGIARALAVRPDLLLMDEPFGALDAVTRRTLQDELLAIHQATGTTILFVTHDLDEAAYLADRIVLLAGTPARIVQDHVDTTPRAARRAGTADRSHIHSIADGMADGFGI
jgi:NitT/TauT family transport system ATP-binding protein